MTKFILRVHILPGLMSLIVVYAIFTIVGVVLTASLPSFFGRTHCYSRKSK